MKNISILTISVVLSLIIYSCGTKKVTNKNTKLHENFKLIGTIDSIELWGGDGTSYTSAIYIKNAKGSSDGIDAEYAYLNSTYGKRGEGYVLVSQSLNSNNGRYYDILTIKLFPGKKIIKVYFDINDFFGKF